MPFEILSGRHPRQAASGAGEEAEDVGDGRHFIINHRQLQETFRTRLRRRLTPGIECPVRRLNGGIDLGCCRFGNLQDHFAGCRVIYRNLLAFTCH